MDPTETGSKYDTLTHLWESDKFNRQNGIEQHKRALQFVRQRGRALDVGCGCTGRFIDLLQAEGFTPEGRGYFRGDAPAGQRAPPGCDFPSWGYMPVAE